MGDDAAGLPTKTAGGRTQKLALANEAGRKGLRQGHGTITWGEPSLSTLFRPGGMITSRQNPVKGQN